MTRYQLTPRARADLLEIAASVARDSRLAAAQVIRKLRGTCRLISNHSEIGESCEMLSPGLRMFTVDNYVIFFRKRDPVQIIRIVHGARDLPSLFENK